MDKNYYEILGLDEDEIIYFLNQNEEAEQTEEAEKMRDEIIKAAYEKRKNEIEEEYQKALKSAKEQFDLKNQVIEYGKKMNATDEVNQERIKNGFESNKLQNDEKVRKIEEKHEKDMKKVECAYEQLKSETLRKAYHALLEIETYDKEMKKISDDVEKKYRIEKYNKEDQYNPDLLETIRDGKLAGEKVVLRKLTKEPVTIYLNDERDIKIKQTATVHYRNITSSYNSYVNEYEITRNVEGKKKTDTVYTELSLLRVGFDKKKNKLVDPYYYDCVVNKLLSEEAIEGSKFNGGYIGLIEQMENGQYETTIDKDGPLSVEEQENLAAVMTLSKREERVDNDGQEPEGEDR